MGVAADCTYTSKYGSQDNATRQILTNWNSASTLYKVNFYLDILSSISEICLQTTFNVSLGIVELQVQDPM
jgi:hypothetical protein